MTDADQFEVWIPFWRTGAERILGMHRADVDQWITKLRAELMYTPGPFMNEGPEFQVALSLARLTPEGPTSRVLGDLTRAIIVAHQHTSDLDAGWKLARTALAPIMERYGGRLPQPASPGA